MYIHCNVLYSLAMLNTICCHLSQIFIRLFFFFSQIKSPWQIPIPFSFRSLFVCHIRIYMKSIDKKKSLDMFFLFIRLQGYNTNASSNEWKLIFHLFFINFWVFFFYLFTFFFVLCRCAIDICLELFTFRWSSTIDTDR